jgi:hypothetical protein
MRTKAEAEATLATLPLLSPVAVTDKAGTRREYAFTLPAGNLCVIEIDATPSDEQLADLARNLPLASKDRDAALLTMKSQTVVDPEVKP